MQLVADWVRDLQRKLTRYLLQALLSEDDMALPVAGRRRALGASNSPRTRRRQFLALARLITGFP